MSARQDNNLATWGDVGKVFGRFATASVITATMGSFTGWVWICRWHIDLLLMYAFMMSLFMVLAVVTSQQLVHVHNLDVRRRNDCPICNPPKGTFRGGRFVPSGWDPMPWWTVEDVIAIISCVWFIPFTAGFMLMVC